MTVSSSSDDSFPTKFSMMVDHHKPECPVKILECCVQGQGHVIIQHFSCLLNCSAFCNQTRYGNASLPVEPYAEKIGLLSSGSRSHSQGLYSKNVLGLLILLLSN